MKPTTAITLVLLTVGVIALAGLGGCTAQLALTYPPPITPPTSVVRGKSLSVVRFADLRKHKRKVVVMKGEIEMGSVVLRKPDSVGGWVARALAAELTHAGAQVQVVNSPAQAQSPVVVTGAVTHLMTYSYNYAFINHCTVNFSLVVKRDGATVLRKQYTGKATRPFFGGPGTTGDFEEVMAAALQDAMSQAVPDIIKVIR